MFCLSGSEYVLVYIICVYQFCRLRFNYQEREGLESLNRFNVLVCISQARTGYLPACVFLCSMIWGKRYLFTLLILVESLTVTDWALNKYTTDINFWYTLLLYTCEQAIMKFAKLDATVLNNKNMFLIKLINHPISKHKYIWILEQHDHECSRSMSYYQSAMFTHLWK